MKGDMISEMFADKFRNDFLKALRRYADHKKVDTSSVQVRLSLPDVEGDDAPLIYQRCVNFQPEKPPVSFRELMAIGKFDIFNREQLVTPIIRQVFALQCQKHQIQPSSISIFLFTDGNDVASIVYNGTQPVSDMKMVTLLEGINVEIPEESS
jgi:hypothetical protein